MSMRNIVLAVSIATLLTACGGGGSSDSTTDNSDNNTNNSSYTGKTDPAQLSAENTTTFLRLFRLAYENEAGPDTVYRSTKHNNFNQNSVISTIEKISKTITQQRDVNSTYDCEVSGTYTVTGTYDENTYIRNLNYTLTNCDNDAYDEHDIKLTGSFNITVPKTYASIGYPDEYDKTTTYTNLKAVTPENTYNYNGTLAYTMILNAAGTQIVGDRKDVNIYRVNQTKSQQELIKYQEIYDSGSTFSGKLCNSAYGCVTVSESANTDDLLLTGANNSKIAIPFDQYSNPYASLDADGDDVYEQTAIPLDQ